MTTLQIYAFYIAPLLMLVAGLGMVGLTKLIERWERRDDHVGRPTH